MVTTTMETILVIEDNAALRRYMGGCLRKAGYEVLLAESGKSAFSHLRAALIDLVLLDLKLGDVDGLEILKTIRHQTDSLPVIIVSTCMDLSVKVDGFEIGCDDYITKPFYSEELLSRVKRQLKRSSSAGRIDPETIAEEVVYGPFRFDVRSYTLYKEGAAVALRKKLADIMLFFLQNPEQVLTKEAIISHCWEDADAAGDNNLYVHIRQLRSSIEETPGKPEFIRTVRGVGFIFGA